MDGVVDQLINAFIGRRCDRNDRDSKHLFHFVDPDAASVTAHLVHHIESQDHGNADLHQLHREVQVALDVRGVDYINDSLGMFPEDKLSCDDLLAAVWGHGIDSRQVRDQRVVMSADHAVLSVHSDAGEIANVLIGSGELVKKRRLAAVLVPCQRKSQLRAFRQRVLIRRIMIAASFTQSGVIDLLMRHTLFIVLLLPAFIPVRFVLRAFQLTRCHRRDSDLRRVRNSERQVISMDHQLHGISHRRVFHYFDHCPGDHAHIKKMLPQSAFTAHFGHYGALADLHVFDCHYALRSTCISFGIFIIVKQVRFV